MGDHDGRSVGVISEPTIEILDVQQLKTNAFKNYEQGNNQHSRNSDIELYAVAASDGLLDFIQPIEIAQRLVQTFPHELKYDANYALMDACEDLILQASKAWSNMGMRYRDDITIAVSKIIQD